MEIVGGAMDDNRTADYFGGAEPVRIDGTNSYTVGGGEERGEISGVEGMLNMMRVIMSTCGREGYVSPGRTYSIFMNVKSKKLR